MLTFESRCEHQLVDVARWQCTPARAARAPRAPLRVSEGSAGEKCPGAQQPARRRAAPESPRAAGLPLRFAAVVQQRDAARQVIEHQQRTRRDIVRVRRLGVASRLRPGMRSK